MAASDNFREAIRAGQLADALVLAMSRAVELNITTWVSSATDVSASAAPPGHRLHTRINLIAGGIENEVGTQFIGNGPYRELHQFHHQQVLDGNKTVQNNLQSLSSLFNVLIALQHYQAHPDEPLQLPDGESRSLPTTKIAELPPVAADNELQLPRFETEPQPLPPRDTWENLAVVAGVTPPVPERLETPQPEELRVADIPRPPAPEAPVSELEIEDWEGIPNREENAIADEEILSADDFIPPPVEANIPTPTESDTEEDWGNLDELSPELLETPLLENEEDSAENWEDFDQIATEISETAPPVLNLPSDTESSDWDEFDTASLDEDSLPSSLNLEAEEEWEDFATETPEAEATALDLDLEEDWGDLEVAEITSPETESSDLNLETDWDSFEANPTETPEAEATALDLDLEEDWGDLEEVEPTTSPETESSDLNLEADWDNFEANPTETPEAEATALDLDLDEDWGDLEVAEITSPETESSDLNLEADWDNFEANPTETPEAEATALDLDLDEDWGDLEVAEITSPETESSDLNLEADWDNFEANPTETPEAEATALDLDLDEDWGDLEVAEITSTETESSDLNLEADWDNFEANPTETPEAEATALDLDLDEDWGDLEVAEITSTETESSDLNLEAAWDNFEANPTETPEAEATALDLDLDEDWGDLEVAEITSTETESSGLELETDWDSFEANPTETPEAEATALDLDLEEDWGDLEVAEITSTETESSDLNLEADWDNFEANPTETPEAEATALDLDLEEDWGDLEVAEITSTETESSDLNLEADWDNFEANPTETPEAEATALDLDLDEDWGDLEEVEPTTSPETPIGDANAVPNLDTANEDEDWLDFEETPSTETPVVTPPPETTAAVEAEENWQAWLAPETPELKAENNEEDWDSDWLNGESGATQELSESESVNLGSEDEWEDFESLDPFASPVTDSAPEMTPELEENWDAFAPEELEPYPKPESFTPDADLEALSQADTESYDAIPPLSPTESLESEEWGDEDETDWNDETVFGSDFSHEASDDDLFSGLTAIQRKRKPPEDESSELPPTE
jgi:hypothetical protein